MSSPKNVFPKTRQDVFAIKSWGYKDCYFYYDEKKKCLCFKGDKYPELHNAQFRKAELIFKDLLQVDVAKLKPPHPNGSIPNFKFLHVDCERFREDMNERGIDCSITIEDRCFRGSGQSAQDLVKPCHFRIPDIVVWPKLHDDVEFVVKKANEHNVVIIPFGGGTNVTCSINCPENETRTIVSLDTTQMNKMLWLDEKSGLACFEAGVGGQGLESHLNERGFTLGHEPDSVEFSTLGGWISTRSSGIKQQFYGNIDKIVIKVRVVTSVGTFDKPCTPRASMGPEIENLIFGHEGTFGVITEAVVKVHKLPPFRQYGSFLFVDFQTGINFMRECAMKKCLPTSLRLIDSYQISYGSAMSYHNSLFSKMKEFVQLKAMNFLFDTSKVSMAVFLMEGQKDDVSKMENSLIKIARKHGAWQGGPAVGQKGYFITFTVGYMRDMMIRLDSIHDSLETSVTWDKLEGCIENTTRTFNEQMKKITAFGNLSYRISQIYHEGVCIYFYLGIGPCDNQRDSFLHICGAIKDTLMKSGASLSHHHGVGKRGQDKFIKYLPNTTKKVLRAIKRDIDPKNIFAVGNLIFNGDADELNAKL